MKKNVKKLVVTLLVFFVNIALFANNHSAKLNNERTTLSPVFIQNNGQLVDFDNNTREEMLFYYKSENLDIYFREKGITYIFKKGEKIPWEAEASKEEQSDLFKEYMQSSTQYYRLDIDFSNPSSQISIEGEGVSKFYNNYYLPQSPDGILNVHQYAKIRYRNVYDGIDFVYFFKDGKLKYDIEVNNPYAFHEIALDIKGADSLEIIDNILYMHSPVGVIKESLPRSYYVDDYASDKNLEIVLLSDRRFAGSDTWATSLTLAEAIKKNGEYD